MDIAAFLSAITNFTNAIQFIENLINRHTGQRRRLLLELQENLSTIELFSKSGVPIDKVILALKTEKLKEALESNFNFNILRNARVSEPTTGDVPFYTSYVGWSTEQLFKNVYLKIAELQRVVEIDSENPNIRKNVRLINIFKLIKLIMVHID